MRRFLVLMSIFLLILIPNVRAYDFELQLGAWGDDGSKENKGVSVEIRTHIYNANQGDFQYFWVGDNLDNGAFIQFGYEYAPGYYCLKGHTVSGKFTCLGDSDHIGGSDARWELQYWPDGNGDDFSYETGPANSVGLDGSWHKYTIQPNTAGGWSFLLDGREVSHVAAAWTKSTDAAFFVAEKGSDTATFGKLGPVEFRNLAYLKDDGWHSVTALYARVGCAVNTDCDVKNPYGVMLEDSGSVITGSGIHQPKNLDLLLGTLTLDLPNQVKGSVDKKYSVSGSSQVPLPPGLHAITLPPTVAIDEKSRLRFDHWSDGLKSPNRTITLKSETTTLKATYVTQYLLAIDSVVPIKGSGWYDKGSTFSVSAPAPGPIYPGLWIVGGQWVFDGWYKDGAYVTNSRSSSITIDGPHSLQARWHQDYTAPIAILTLLGLAAFVLIYRRVRHKL